MSSWIKRYLMGIFECTPVVYFNQFPPLYKVWSFDGSRLRTLCVCVMKTHSHLNISYTWVQTTPRTLTSRSTLFLYPCPTMQGNPPQFVLPFDEKNLCFHISSHPTSARIVPLLLAIKNCLKCTHHYILNHPPIFWYLDTPSCSSKLLNLPHSKMFNKLDNLSLATFWKSIYRFALFIAKH